MNTNPVIAHAVSAPYLESGFQNQQSFVETQGTVTPDAQIFNNTTNEASAREFLKGSGWPAGLIEVSHSPLPNSLFPPKENQRQLNAPKLPQKSIDVHKKFGQDTNPILYL